MATWCSNKVQQPQRTEQTGIDPHRPTDLRLRPPTTFPRLDGKEKVTAERFAAVTASGLATSASVRTLNHSIVADGAVCPGRRSTHLSLVLGVGVQNTGHAIWRYGPGLAECLGNCHDVEVLLARPYALQDTRVARRDSPPESVLLRYVLLTTNAWTPELSA